MAMRTFKIEQSKVEIITSHGGLALVGQGLNQLTSLSMATKTDPPTANKIDPLMVKEGQEWVSRVDAAEVIWCHT